MGASYHKAYLAGIGDGNRGRTGIGDADAGSVLALFSSSGDSLLISWEKRPGSINELTRSAGEPGSVPAPLRSPAECVSCFSHPDWYHADYQQPSLA